MNGLKMCNLYDGFASIDTHNLSEITSSTILNLLLLLFESMPFWNLKELIIAWWFLLYQNYSLKKNK